MPQIEVPDTIVAKNSGAFATAEQTIANWLKNSSTIVSCAASPAPQDGYVLTATSATSAEWKPAGSGGGTINMGTGEITLVDGYAALPMSLSASAHILWSRKTPLGVIGDVTLAAQNTTGFALQSSSDEDQSVLCWTWNTNTGIPGPSGGGVEPGPYGTVYWTNGVDNMWTGDPILVGGPNSTYSGLTDPVYPPSSVNGYNMVYSSDGRIVVTQEDNRGSYTIAPRPYETSSVVAPRTDKQFGSFQLAGALTTKTLSFSTYIHGFQMPANSVLVGKFLIGWMNNGTSSAGGAMSFLYTITSNASRNINAFFNSLSYLHCTPGTTQTLTSGSPPDGETRVCEWMIPTNQYTPFFQVIIPSSPTNDWSFKIQATHNGATSNIAKFFWQNEQSWGNT